MHQNIQWRNMETFNLEKSLHWRYATKLFDSNRKILPETWKTLENALLLAPSSYGLQPWKFIVIEDSKLREKLKAVSWDQSQVTDCSHYVVLLYMEKMDRKHVSRFLDRMSLVRQLERPKLAAYEEVIVSDLLKGPRSAKIDTWAKCQTYIAMGFALQAAASLQVDACPMEGLDPEAYDEILGLKGSGFRTIASIAFGYRSASDVYQAAKKVRFEPHEVIEHR